MFTQIQCLTQIQIVHSNQREIHKASIFLKNKNKRLLKLRMIQEKKNHLVSKFLFNRVIYYPHLNQTEAP